jgi:hypothetical protein
MDLKSSEHVIHAYRKELYEVQQNLGIALGYPRYADDPKNFPEATEVDGVCIGELTADALAMQAAKRIIELEAQVKNLQDNSISKDVFDNMSVEIMKAQQAQIRIFDLDYPPYAVQGNTEEGMFDLLTAHDVNGYITQIRELGVQIKHLEVQLLKCTMHRDGMYAKADALEETSLGSYRELVEQNTKLKQEVIARERIARRALLIVANAGTIPVTPENSNRAHRALLALDSHAGLAPVEVAEPGEPINRMPYVGGLMAAGAGTAGAQRPPIPWGPIDPPMRTP